VGERAGAVATETMGAAMLSLLYAGGKKKRKRGGLRSRGFSAEGLRAIMRVYGDFVLF